MDQLPTNVMTLIDYLSNYGAKCYIVGGWVRDYLLGINNNDIDIEVFDIDYESLLVLSKMLDDNAEGFRKYGVIKLPNLGVDLSLPKYEITNNESNYNKIRYEIDPHLSLKQASMRRDLSINCVYYDPLTNEIIDPQLGVEDVINHRCRIINPNFSDDPVRLIRLIYYTVKYDLTIDQQVLDIIEPMCIDNISEGKLKSYINKIKSVDGYYQLLIDKGLLEKVEDYL